jgi:hypothetical protein
LCREGRLVVINVEAQTFLLQEFIQNITLTVALMMEAVSTSVGKFPPD